MVAVLTVMVVMAMVVLARAAAEEETNTRMGAVRDAVEEEAVVAVVEAVVAAVVEAAVVCGGCDLGLPPSMSTPAGLRGVRVTVNAVRVSEVLVERVRVRMSTQMSACMRVRSCMCTGIEGEPHPLIDKDRRRRM